MIVALSYESPSFIYHSPLPLIHEWVRILRNIWPKVEHESSVWGCSKDTRAFDVKSRDLSESIEWAGRTERGGWSIGRVRCRGGSDVEYRELQLKF